MKSPDYKLSKDISLILLIDDNKGNIIKTAIPIYDLKRYLYEGYLETLRKFVVFLKIETPVYLEHLTDNDMSANQPTGHILLVE